MYSLSFLVFVILLCWLCSLAAAVSSYCIFFDFIFTFLTDRSESIRAPPVRNWLFQFSEAWRKRTESVPFGITTFKIQTKSVLVMDEDQSELLNQDGDQTKRMKPSLITSIFNWIETVLYQNPNYDKNHKSSLMVV